MNHIEFSNQFDVELNSFGNVGPAIELDEYEKSVFLTKAQESIVEGLYNGTMGYSFEESEGLRRYLSNLVETVEIKDEVEYDSKKKISNIAKLYLLPKDLWFITYECVTIKSSSECMDGRELMVTPIAQDEYRRTVHNPFRGANERRALRLDIKDNMVEIVCKYDIEKYLVRYIRKLKPIILTELPNDLSINGFKKVTECELHPSLHKSILDTAVKLAVQTRFTSGGENANSSQSN